MLVSWVAGHGIVRGIDEAIMVGCAWCRAFAKSQAMPALEVHSVLCGMLALLLRRCLSGWDIGPSQGRIIFLMSCTLLWLQRCDKLSHFSGPVEQQLAWMQGV